LLIRSASRPRNDMFHCRRMRMAALIGHPTAAIATAPVLGFCEAWAQITQAVSDRLGCGLVLLPCCVDFFFAGHVAAFASRAGAAVNPALSILRRSACPRGVN